MNKPLKFLFARFESIHHCTKQLIKITWIKLQNTAFGKKSGYRWQKKYMINTDLNNSVAFVFVSAVFISIKLTDAASKPNNCSSSMLIEEELNYYFSFGAIIFLLPNVQLNPYVRFSRKVNSNTYENVIYFFRVIFP